MREPERPMPNQVLIVADGPDARRPAEVARSLDFIPVIAGNEQEASELLDRESFSLIAVSGANVWQRVRALAESKQPMTRVLELPPQTDVDDTAVRRLLTRYLERPVQRPRFSTEERYRFLSTILESFTATLDLKEVLRRIVTTTREELAADRAWLLHPVTEQTEFARVAFSVTAPDCNHDIDENTPVPISGSQQIIRRALESSLPIVSIEGDADFDGDLAGRYEIRSRLLQILRPREEEPWIFGM